MNVAIGQLFCELLYECLSPRDCLKKAFQTSYIDNESLWLDIILDRNRSAHIHDEKEAAAICKKIEHDYYPALQQLRDFLHGKLDEFAALS